MKFANLFSISILCCLCSILLSQDSTIQGEADRLRGSDTIGVTESIRIGKSKVLSSEFNHGIISDPFLLLQGQVAGLQVYNRGGDPNVQSIARVRGVSSLDSDIQPLIVIDGIPNAAIENIDPNDIEFIEVLKKGFAKAQYGARGANGVIRITTKKHTSDSLLAVQYNGAFGLSKATRDINLFSTSEFLSNGGSDFGSDIDYLSEIKRTGISQAHGLSLSKGFKNYHIKVSGNYRNTEGILKKSGFQQYNGAANLSLNLFDDKLNMGLNGKVTQKNQNLSFTEAFRYAVTANPTFPILAKDSPFPFSGELFGGYFEPLGLFASYNPLAMLEFNERTNDTNLSSYSAHVNYELLDGLEVGIQYANQNQKIDYNEYGQETSYYLGRISGGERSGYGTFNVDENDFIFSDYYIKYSGEFDRIGIILKAGYSYQEFTSESSSLSYKWPDLSTVFETESARTSNKLISFYNVVNLERNDKLFLDIGLRYEGSSLFVAESKWQFYPSAQIAYDLGGVTVNENDHLFLSGGFGVTGSQNDPYFPNTQGSFLPIYLVEKNSEFDLGVNYSNNRLQLSFEAFSRASSNVNISRLAPFPDPYTNISTKGFDITLGAKIVDNENFRYSSNLLLSTYKSSVDFEFKISYASPGGPGFGSASLLTIGEGGEFGEIYAPVFEGVDSDGFTIYKDVNNDGAIKVFSPDDADTDYTIVGSAVPDFELGWQHNLKVSSFDIRVLFRGAFGHSLINLNRMFNENNPLINDVYNNVKTSKAVDGLNEARYSSLYVEDASFIKLDNLTISRSFQIGAANRTIQLSLIGQNLLTLTGYTGSDPEPSFYDFGGSGYFSPGIDRRASYRPSRTISIGAKFDLN